MQQLDDNDLSFQHIYNLYHVFKNSLHNHMIMSNYMQSFQLQYLSYLSIYGGKSRNIDHGAPSLPGFVWVQSKFEKTCDPQIQTPLSEIS